MIITARGETQFSDVYEMYYHLFMEMGLSIDENTNYIYDQDTMIPLKYKDKYIKATVIPIELYSGKTDIVFDPSKNYNLMVTLFGYYVDKEDAMNEDFRFIAQYTEDDANREKQRVVVKTGSGNIYSNYYYNRYLGYIENIFNISGNLDVDLSNFDISATVY